MLDSHEDCGRLQVLKIYSMEGDIVTNTEQKMAKLERENEQLKAKLAAKSNIRFKVAAKGGVSVYGLNSRFPVTLYAQQWTRLLASGSAIEQFIDTNRDKLAFKDVD